MQFAVIASLGIAGLVAGVIVLAYNQGFEDGFARHEAEAQQQALHVTRSSLDEARAMIEAGNDELDALHDATALQIAAIEDAKRQAEADAADARDRADAAHAGHLAALAEAEASRPEDCRCTLDSELPALPGP